jgi:hypothetical protein
MGLVSAALLRVACGIGKANPVESTQLSARGRRSLTEISPNQVRRFTDTACLAASPRWMIIKEIADRTIAACEDDAKKVLLLDLR